MTTALDLALNVSLASYARIETTPDVVVIRDQKLVKVNRAKPAKAASSPKATAPSVLQPTHPSPNGMVPTLKLPAAGTIGAKAFLLMMRGAKSRDEKIVAIAAFVGYDGKGDFASQEMAATTRAKGEISPVKVVGPSREEIRSAQRSAAGYVAGMPDNQRKIVRDLLGRENLAVLTRNDHVRDARDHSRPIAQRKLSIGLARLEAERLVQIRADIAKLCG